MKRMIKLSIAMLMLTGPVLSQSAFSEEESQSAADEKPADKAVDEYLRLRREGKRHYEALSKVRADFGLSDQEINQAANQLGSNGYPNDALAPASPERSPSVAGKKKVKPE